MSEKNTSVENEMVNASTSRADSIGNELVALYKKDKPKAGFILVEYTDSYDLQLLNKFKIQAKKNKPKSFHIVNIEPLNSATIKGYAFGVNLPDKKEKKGEDKIQISDMTGLFKICFSDDTFMYYAKWVTGGGRSRTVEGMFAAEEDIWCNFLTLLKREKKKASRPKVGVFRAFSTNVGGSKQLVYNKIKKLIETPIVHPAIEEIEDDIKHFYGNIKLYTRYGMPGTRKIMLIGEPGTGKSSVCMKLSKKFASDKCVVFTTSIEDCALHLSKCAKYNMSTFVVLEDAESTLRDPNSNLLNFLDGIDQPTNKNGAYVIMTTNHPEAIEPRILQRPGRVDNIIAFGSLTGEYALSCAEIYFEDILFFKNKEKNKKEIEAEKKIKEELLKLFDEDGKGMTGAQIKGLAQSSASYAVSKSREVDIDLIREVKQKMQDKLKNARELAQENSMLGSSRKLGFSFPGGEDKKTERKTSPLTI